MTVSIYREESRIANYWQRGRTFFSTVYPRLVGALIILKLDINLKLNFDASALKALKDVCEQIAREAEASIATVRRIWTTWLWTFLIIAILVPCWLLLCLVGMTARSWHKLKTAMQLITGQTTSASLQML